MSAGLALVTGGAGFIGSHLVTALLDRGWRVRVLDDLSTGSRANLAHLDGDGDADGDAGAIDFVEGSVVDPATCARAVEGVRTVFHQAAIPSVPRSVADPAATHAACATGTLNILDAARRGGVERFVYAASSSAYGDTVTLPKREADTGTPKSPYAVAKLAGEHYCAAWHAVWGLETVALRYFNVFGPRQDPDSPYAAVVPLFVRHALAGTAPTIDGDGEQTRDFTHVSNAVHANLLAAERPAERVAGRVFNVGCGERISINRLWAEVRRLTGARVEAVHGPARAGDVRDSLASLEAARADLGYEVRTPLARGLEDTVAWLRRMGEGEQLAPS
ncbi:MAG: SDR family oxidoreductase [Longimicrobiales bacterium]|nr:SDR family oxidoreductase [Longimicrobiales bacterium]